MEIEEIVRMIIFVAVLVVLIGAAALLLSGKGMEVIEAIKNLLRFGR